MHSSKRKRAPVALWIAVVLVGCHSATDSAGAITAEQERELRDRSAAYAGAEVKQLVSSPDAMRLAEQLFGAHCASCHGTDIEDPSRGVPDLTRGRFKYGTSAAAIETTIADGRHSVMPAMGRRFGEVQLGQLVAYVRSLGSRGALSDYEQRGRDLFVEHCAECHGAEGRGKPEQGTPNLADDYWQHGDSMMNVRLVITRGVESRCPAQGDELSQAEIDLLTAYVLSLISIV